MPERQGCKGQGATLKDSTVSTAQITGWRLAAFRLASRSSKSPFSIFVLAQLHCDFMPINACSIPASCTATLGYSCGMPCARNSRMAPFPLLQFFGWRSTELKSVLPLTGMSVSEVLVRHFGVFDVSRRRDGLYTLAEARRLHPPYWTTVRENHWLIARQSGVGSRYQTSDKVVGSLKHHDLQRSS